MDDPTADELLAHAIGCVALNVLNRLADDQEARRKFLEGFLGLVEELGIGLTTDVGMWPGYWG